MKKTYITPSCRVECISHPYLLRALSANGTKLNLNNTEDDGDAWNDAASRRSSVWDDDWE